ncbi:TPA: tetratricopeptide repeat protein [Candidatus Poribacteria bacterium]|nr:tetratricopeptide repeat protein [Candidatus Poribacteria bacterium]
MEKKRGRQKQQSDLDTNRIVAKVGSHADIDAELHKALSFHQAGCLQQAEEGYRRILKVNPQSEDALHLLGVLIFQLGRYDTASNLIRQAIELNPEQSIFFDSLGTVLKEQKDTEKAMEAYDRALEIDPNNFKTCNNLGILLQEIGRYQESVQIFRKAVEINPRYDEAIYSLGLVLQTQGNLEESIQSYNRVIEINPHHIGAYNNLGNVLGANNQFEQAIQVFKQALSINPHVAEIHNNLGVVLKAVGQIEGAIQAYQKSVAINPDYPEAHYNLGIALEELGDLGDAFASYQTAVRLAPNKTPLWINFANVCQFTRPTGQSDQLKHDLINCLHADGVEHQPIGKFVASFLKASPVFQEVIFASESKTSNEFLDYMLENSQTNGLFLDDLILILLTKVIIEDLTIEKLLTKIRNFLLDEIVKNLDSGQFDFTNTHFINALASQSFLNEYVYVVSEEEVSKIDIVKKHVESKVENIKLREKVLIGILSCYIPAYELNNAEEILFLGKQAGDSSFLNLLVLQIEEPLIELGIRQKIPATGKVQNNISEKIKLQYEENPYPRWVSSHQHTPQSFPSRIKREFPHLSLNGHERLQSPQVLVAGCGTGKQAIQAALQLKNSLVTAIDLSLTSLAYAERKTRELGINNIKYLQVDILDLKGWNTTFDIIECVGVLHHMEDPFYGWQLLTDLLNPHGFMFIGLYSKLARRAIVETRNFIQDKGYSATKTDIRRCRQEIISMKNSPINDVCRQSPNFYTLSSCRDLIFNLHEEYFTLPQIDGILKELNLEFVGFKTRDKRVKKRYSERFPEDIFADSFSNWHQYEKEYPDTFAGMYQFWVKQKL